MRKKLLAMMLATAMGLSLTACGGEGGDGGSSGDGGVSITIFNSKSEVQSQFEAMAEEYSKTKGVNVEIYYSNDTVAAHMATKYSANDPYTISMVDAKDVYSLAEEHAADLSNEKWVANTDYAISVGGKVVGFPVCVEARGVIYNAEAIEAVTGKEFKPEEYKTLDAFQGLLDELVAGGMETPTGIMKEDWSLGAHFLCEVYEEQPDVEAYISALHAGTADLANNPKWTAKMDTFDALKKYNYAAGSPVAAEREVTEQKLAEGEIAFMFGGNWDWSVINAYEYSEKMGMMPVPQNTDDGANEKLVGGGSKYMFIDSSENTSDEQRQAAKDFLNWIVFSEIGQQMLVKTGNIIPPFQNNPYEPSDPLSADIYQKVHEGKAFNASAIVPNDHWAVLGAAMQKYLVDRSDREELTESIQEYWDEQE